VNVKLYWCAPGLYFQIIGFEDSALTTYYDGSGLSRERAWLTKVM
jgi:hypothetical protein